MQTTPSAAATLADPRVVDLLLPKRIPLIGKTLAHYEIISLLGKGGMGEVTNDGERFLANERPAMERSNQGASLIQNWTRILDR